jgi:putative FmdB family regulatory protein
VPIYEYQCEKCGDSFEILQKMADDPLVTCQKCGGALRKVLHPVAIHFKGSGFYTTDYGKGSGHRGAAREATAESESSGEKGSAAGDGSSGSQKSSDSDKSSGPDKASASSDAKPAKEGAKSREKQKAT